MATKKERLLTPVGTARYSWLKDPDVTFTPEGVYRTQLLIPANECVELRKALDARAEEALEKAKKENPGKSIKLNPPYSHDVDEDGKPTGDIVFKFKTMSKFTKRDGTTIERKIPAFDAKLNRIISVPNVYSGSRLRINFTPMGYYVAAHRSAGLSLYLNSYQILELVTFASDGEYYGYEEVDDGYIAPVVEEQPDDSTTEELRADLKLVCDEIARVTGGSCLNILQKITKDVLGAGCFYFEQVEPSNVVAVLSSAKKLLNEEETKGESVAFEAETGG